MDAANLRRALKRVRANKGSPGVDGMTIEELPAYLKEAWPRLKEELLAGTYQPQPVKRVEIPKPGGGVRQLGIPTVVDRFIQQAILQVLTPLYDPTFSPSSYGFRPGKSAHQALAAGRTHVASGKVWVVDLDLEKFFDRVNHDVLLGRLAKRIGDKPRAAADPPVPGGGRAGRRRGGRAGRRDAPGRAALAAAGEHPAGRAGQGAGATGHAFCRYADDCNIYVQSQRAGERVLASVTRFLERTLRLKVNHAKSAVARRGGADVPGVSHPGHGRRRAWASPPRA